MIVTDDMQGMSIRAAAGATGVEPTHSLQQSNSRQNVAGIPACSPPQRLQARRQKASLKMND
jgi:hypothetical protein